MPIRPHVVVVGSGFGGLNAALRLAELPVDITVIDRDNYHGFWPLLYQVATAGLGADDIAHPIRSIYAHCTNVDVRIGTVSGVRLEDRLVEIDGEPAVPYDYLILAAGSSTSDFGIPGVQEHAYTLKTLPDAVRLRNHILTTFEQVDAAGPDAHPGGLTIVLVGGGPTGVEMAGALSELIGHNLASDFHHLDLTRARVVLVEMTDHLLPGFSAVSQEAALRTLRDKGIEVRFQTRLAQVTDDGVTFERRDVPRLGHGGMDRRACAPTPWPASSRVTRAGVAACRWGPTSRFPAIPRCSSSATWPPRRGAPGSPSPSWRRWPSRPVATPLAASVAAWPASRPAVFATTTTGSWRPSGDVRRWRSCPAGCGSVARWAGWPGSASTWCS